MSSYYHPPADIISGVRARSLKINDIIQSVEDGFDLVEGVIDSGGQGIRTYVHYAYALNADGSSGFSVTYTGSEIYIGILTDTIVADSTDYLDYEWSLFRGSDGSIGGDGTAGVSIVWQGSFGSPPANPVNGWAYYNTNDLKSYVYQDGVWDRMTEDGSTGPSGADASNWGSTLTFSALDYNTVGWTGGHIYTAGVDYIISSAASGTGNMTAETAYYIYLKPSVSITELQVTTVATDAVGIDQILVCVAYPNSNVLVTAQFQVFGGRGGVFINADNIAAKCITADEIVGNSLSAISANIGTVTSGIIQSNDWSAAAGMQIDLDLATITIREAAGLKIASGADILFEHGGDIKFTSVTAPTACTATLVTAAGNLTIGAYSYKVTYVNDSGETELGVISNEVTTDATHLQVDLTAIPISSSTSVTKRKIYRTKAGGSSYYYLSEIANNTGTTYTDNIPDTSITVDGTYRSNNSFGRLLVDGVIGISLGSDNTFVGQLSGYSNTTGFYNSAIGVSALQSNTTGYYNSAIGVSALLSNTTGRYNSALGVYALLSNTVGAYNSAIGYYALYSNSTGYYNSAMGYFTLHLNTTGFYNSAIGALALWSNTTGDSNAALGEHALYINSTGSGNIAIGSFAGGYETGSNAFYVNNQNRANTAGDKAESILYGVMAVAASDQTLAINAATTVSYAFTASGAVTHESTSLFSGAVTHSSTTQLNGVVTIAGSGVIPGNGLVLENLSTISATSPAILFKQNYTNFEDLQARILGYASALYFQSTTDSWANSTMALKLSEDQGIFSGNLRSESGVLILKETAKPSAITGYLQAWTETDNKLHIIDGDGTEYTLDMTAV